MQFNSLTFLCCVLLLSGTIVSGNEFAVKRGHYPFMGFLYYPDETIVDSTGGRFLRGATLIRLNWVISSAVDVDLPAFPVKTLLVRMGAVSIDSNFTLNLDEDEQEREIIMIVHPSNQKITDWWLTDITLLKTLLPFDTTKAVSSTQLLPKIDFPDKTFSILVYVKRSDNSSEDRILAQIAVELLTPSNETCGDYFSEKTMTCGNSKDTEKISTFPQFCQGNRGSPLLCESDVVGLQTYIDTSCKEPYLYQLLSAWDTFLSCGIEEKCNKEECRKVCTVINKDTPSRRLLDDPNQNTKNLSTLIANAEEKLDSVTEVTKVNEEITEPNKELPKLPINSTKKNKEQEEDTKESPEETIEVSEEAKESSEDAKEAPQEIKEISDNKASPEVAKEISESTTKYDINETSYITKIEFSIRRTTSTEEDNDTSLQVTSEKQDILRLETSSVTIQRRTGNYRVVYRAASDSNYPIKKIIFSMCVFCLVMNSI